VARAMTGFMRAVVLLAVIAGGAAPALADDDSGNLFPIGDVTRFPAKLREIPTIFFTGDQLPPRPGLPLELGDGFLDTGNLSPGFDMPGGAVWQPRLWVYGDYRSAVQILNSGTAGKPVTEWANRLDAYANLQLTGTERLLVGMHPLDQDQSGRFSGYSYSPTPHWNNSFDGTISELFFEGDFGSTLPNLDSKGDSPIDFGYSIGRQPLQFQNGIMVNDIVDAVGITRNNIHVPGTSNMRITGIYGWNLNRPNRPEGSGRPFITGLDSSTETLDSTIDIDAMYIGDEALYGSEVNFGAALTHRFGLIFSTLRINSSLATSAPTAVSTNGSLISGEFSFTPYNSDDNVYVDPFVAIGNYSSAAQDPMAAGPLSALGILFAGYGYGTSYGIGTLRTTISSVAQDAVGFATGYQAFYGDHAENVTLELGGRQATTSAGFDALGLGAQYQHALTQRIMWQVNASGALQESRSAAYALRTEIYVQF
jgi:hypothetical protein